MLARPRNLIRPGDFLGMILIFLLAFTCYWRKNAIRVRGLGIIHFLVGGHMVLAYKSYVSVFLRLCVRVVRNVPSVPRVPLVTLLAV